MEQFKITYEDDEGYETKVEVPGKREKCGDCDGRGSTYLGFTSSDQPAFTSEDFDREGGDFREDYMQGRYDKQCPTCKGAKILVVINENACSKEEMVYVKHHYDMLKCIADMNAEMEAERRMGA